MNDGYALLIGVDDYSAYGKDYDLQGSLNDVSLWWQMCRDLGYSPQNIRVLTSPALHSADLHGAYTGAATHDEIVKGLQWLAGNLGRNRDAVGLLTYSGYGDQADLGPVICPTDTAADGKDLKNVVDLRAMQRIFATAGAAQGLTVVLDCCHTHIVGYGSPLGLRNHGNEAVPIPAIGDRMFYAAKPGTEAYQGQFAGGRWQGGLTWAFMTAREQWGLFRDQAGHPTVTISYAEMQHRMQALLDAITFGQTVGLATPAGKGEDAWPVFGSSPGRTYGNPPPRSVFTRVQEQVDPTERVLTLNWDGGSGDFAQIAAVGTYQVVLTDGNQLNHNSEYWWVNKSVAANLAQATSIGVSSTPWIANVVNSCDPPSWGSQACFVAEFPGWKLTPSPLQPLTGQSCRWFKGQVPDPGGQGNVSFWLQMLYSTPSGTPPTSRLLGLAWFIDSSISLAGNTTYGIPLPSSISAISPPSLDGTYYGIVQSPLTNFTG